MEETQKRALLLTGNPSVGKTTVLMNVVGALKEKGYCVGGMVSREAREGGTRVGFEILDLINGRRGWLAHVNQKNGPQVGKYCINIEDLNTIGAQAVTKAVKKCEVIVIDEIGPMELFSKRFKEAVRKALESHKLVLAVVHLKAQDTLINEAKKREDAEIIIVTKENREKLNEQIKEKALKVLSET